MTVADLDAYRDAQPTWPDDGHRYELIDGTLIVTPAPALRHQVVHARLAELLMTRCPGDLIVLLPATDVVLADDTVVQPDMLVVPRTGLDGQKVLAGVLLAVEILSPSTRLYDLNLKRARYEQAGIPSYWVVDPDELWLRVWDLRDGVYVETAHVSDDASWEATSPYAVRVTPARLAD